MTRQEATPLTIRHGHQGNSGVHPGSPRATSQPGPEPDSNGPHLGVFNEAILTTHLT